MLERIKPIIDIIIPNGDFTYIRYVFLSLIWFSMFCLFYHLRKSRFFEKSANSMMEKLSAHILDDARGVLRKNIKKNSFIDKLQQKYIYSRIQNHIPFMSFDIWLAFLILLFVATLTICLFVIEKALPSIFIAFGITAIPLFIEIVLVQINFKKVDDNMIEFLNLLGNFSSTNSEVSNIFSMIYSKFDAPLSTVLREYTLEAETYGSLAALDIMSNKLEHPKFKEIIKNLRICIYHANSFKVITDNNKRIINDYEEQKKEEKSLAYQNSITFVIMISMLIITLSLSQQMIEINIWTFLLTNTLGQIALFIMLACVLRFAWKIYTIYK